MEQKVGWVSDRIKRKILKLPYDKGGLKAPDIFTLNTALKVKQFLRSMATRHPINLIQKFQLERLGYNDYFKNEYAKICRHDVIVKTYQMTCNLLTDKIREHCSALPLPDPDNFINSINVVASTDVLEYLMRKRELMLINRFGPLANVGVTNFKQLHNEAIFPRNDNLGDLAKYILRFFPSAWSVVMTDSNGVNEDVAYEAEFPVEGLKFARHNQVTVKTIRAVLEEGELAPTYPFMEFNKFELLTNNLTFNPFTTIRKCIRPPRDKFFKYRILQGDIFCKERMFRFRMVDSPECDFCGAQRVVETIKHMIWECPRVACLWVYLREITREAYNVDCVRYETIILGQDQGIPLVESLILIILKLIMVKNRSGIVTIEQVKSRIKTMFFIEKQCKFYRTQKFRNRWGSIEPILFRNND